MSSEDKVWAVGRITMGVPTRIVARARAFGAERVPRSGGVV